MLDKYKMAKKANKKRLVQGGKNVRALVPKNMKCANVFLPFIFHAYECCMAKLIRVRY